MDTRCSLSSSLEGEGREAESDSFGLAHFSFEVPRYLANIGRSDYGDCSSTNLVVSMLEIP